MMNLDRITAMLMPFYLGAGVDLHGRYIHQIWTWNIEDLECVHDYIQWLFPLTEVSRFNNNAPLVTPEIIAAFQQDDRLRANLRRSLGVMLHFYGWQYNDLTAEIDRGANYAARTSEWLAPLDHNYLRITRILKCSIAFGLSGEARAFYRCLDQTYRESSDLIGAETFQYWTQAIESVN